MKIGKNNNFTMNNLRIAGAQIPVSTDVQFNKKEILKSIDWAKKNEVNHLLTPEGSLSGYTQDWMDRFDEIVEAEKEIQTHLSDSGVFLHLGTLFKQEEFLGNIKRNQIRHYAPWGQFMGATNKTYAVPDIEKVLPRSRQDNLQFVPLSEEDLNLLAVGLICNDMWGSSEAGGEPLTTQIKKTGQVSLILHATNGRKHRDDDYHYDAYNAWHDGYLRMAAFNTIIPILTVDSCVPWDWNPESDVPIDFYPTSSESGVIDFLGWKTDVPRKGRQYFYYDLDVSLPPFAKIYKHLDECKMKGKYVPTLE